MGTLSMTASDLHAKYHWPPARCSDLLGGVAQRVSWARALHLSPQ